MQTILCILGVDLCPQTILSKAILDFSDPDFKKKSEKQFENWEATQKYF